VSRSNPANNKPNPSTRWFEWNGEQGTVRYYDKQAKQNVDVGQEFTFVLLDELGAVGGWHEASQSGIYSNEVRDTRQDVLLVKSFKGGTLAEGLYKAIKDKVAVAGGQFVANCYIAFKGDDGFAIGSIKFKGAALSSWMDFRKANRAQLYKKAIQIIGSTEGKKGRVTYRMPTFRLNDLSDATNDVAIGLDRELQEFLSSYLARTKRDQVDSTAHHDEPSQASRDYDDGPERDPIHAPEPDFIPTADDIPF
jgi:hypothetical protein